MVFYHQKGALSTAPLPGLCFAGEDNAEYKNPELRLL